MPSKPYRGPDETVNVVWTMWTGVTQVSTKRRSRSATIALTTDDLSFDHARATACQTGSLAAPKAIISLEELLYGTAR